MLKKLLERDGELRKRSLELEKIGTAENRSYTPEEFSEMGSIVSELRTLKTEIENARSIQEINRASATPVDLSIGDGTSKKEARDLSKYSFIRAINNFDKLNGLEGEMHEEGRRELRAINQAYSENSVIVPSQIIGFQNRDGQVKNILADGGVSVYKEFKGYNEHFNDKLVLNQLGVEILTGLQGDISFLFENDQIEAEWLGEIDENTIGKFTMSEKVVTPLRLSKTQRVSNMLLKQSVLSVESLIQKQCAYANASAIEKAAILGSGAANIPLGLLNHPDVPVLGISANGGVLTYAQAVKMETALEDENSLGGSLGYLTNQRVKGYAKTTPIDPGSGIFLMPTSNELNGYKVAITNYMTKDGTKGTGTALSSIVYGDWSQLGIYMWGAMELIVDRVTLARKSQTQLTMNTFANTLVKRPKSFVKSVDVKTA